MEEPTATRISWRRDTLERYETRNSKGWVTTPITKLFLDEVCRGYYFRTAKKRYKVIIPSIHGFITNDNTRNFETLSVRSARLLLIDKAVELLQDKHDMTKMSSSKVFEDVLE